MNNRPAAPSFGWNLGILSGVFAALQVLISASTARDNMASIESMRWALSSRGNLLPLLGSLGSVVFVTYLSIIVTGAISLMLSWHAGRITAYTRGRRAGGAGAGFQVALLSGGIWIVFSVLISLLMHADGTITGVVASSADGSSLGAQLTGLLVQEVILAAIGLGLGAWAGYLGSGRAELPEAPPAGSSALASPAGYMYPAYPAAGGYPVYGGYPGYPGYPMAAQPYTYPSPYEASAQSAPPAPMGSVPPTYPPPPDYYRAPDAAYHSPAQSEPQAAQHVEHQPPSPPDPASHHTGQ